MKLKYLFTLVFWCLFFTLNSQNHKLYPNVNPLTRLTQKIEGNQLFLSDQNKILKVDLYNRKTEALINYNNSSKSIAIDLDNLESSYYTVMVYNSLNRIIVLGVDIVNTNPLKINTTSANISNLTELKTEIKNSAKTKREAKAYWVIREIQKHSGSTLSTYYYHNKMYLENAIRKNKRDMKSFSGRNNKLTIYEVYDLDRFTQVKSKLVDNYYYAKDLVLNEKERNAFNIVPFYKSKVETTLISEVRR